MTRALVLRAREGEARRCSIAGDWLKIEKATLRKPEILTLSALLNLHPDQVLGMVLRFWDWADSNSVDGSIGPQITEEIIDSHLGTPGLAAALLSVGWLGKRSQQLIIPRFGRHMGSSAKKRALTALRVGRSRSNAACNADVTHQTLQPLLSSSLPAEEENTKEAEVRPGRPRSDLPCDNPERFPDARAVVDHFQKLHPHHSRGKGIEVVIGRLNDGEPADRLKAAAEGYAASCRSKGIETPRRLSAAVFYSPGGEWEIHDGVRPSEGVIDAAYLRRQAQRRREYEDEEAKAREAAARRAGKATT